MNLKELFCQVDIFMPFSNIETDILYSVGIGINK